MISDDFNYSGGGVVAVIAWLEAPELISNGELEDLVEALPNYNNGNTGTVSIAIERGLLSLAIMGCIDGVNSFLRFIDLDDNGKTFRSMATEIIRRRNGRN